MKDEKEAIYWKIVGALGYPTGVEGMILGSPEHRVFSDLKTLFEFGKLIHGENKIGWAAGMEFSNLIERYRDAYYGFLFAYSGEKAVVERIISDMERESMEITNLCGEVIKTTRYVKEWVKNGGLVKKESFLHMVGETVVFGEIHRDSWNPMREIEEMLRRSFSNDKLKRILIVLGTGNAGEESIQMVKKSFEKEKSRVLRAYGKSERSVEEMARIAGFERDNF